MTMTHAIPKRLEFVRKLLLAAFAACCCLLLPAQAHADGNVSCTMNSEGINFGSGPTGTGSVSYTCDNYNSTNTTPVSFTLCLGIGTPSYPGTTAQPEMQGGGSTLNFNLYTNPSDTTVWTTSTPITTAVSIPSSGNGSQTSISGTLSFYGLIPSGQGAPASSYYAAFYNTVLGIMSSGTCQSSPSGSSITGQMFTLDINATVANNCTVAANGPVDLGTVLASATNLAGSTTISVNCPTGTAYTIGLAPSNGDSNGAGVLMGTGSNTDRPPYQLHSGSSSGPIWGNTATATNVGNGVAGTGTGSTQSFGVFVDVAGANFTPDTYADTVTVNLNF